MDAIIKCQGVCKAYGGVIANDKISLEVPPGRITGLIGPNGSGKTTLFNSIVGYHPIDAGSITFEGREISQLRTQEISRLGLLRTFQQTRVYKRMNCVENMLVSIPNRSDDFWSMFQSSTASSARRAEQLLDFVGLYQKRYLTAGSLSFGQQKLLEFAMALMREPKVLLLDEPTAGINPTLINGLIDRLKRAVSELGVTLFIIEHNMPVIMDLADNIYCLAGGRLLAHGRPAEIQSDKRVLSAYLGEHYGSEAA
jgi:ABC-type branched-subunit amino acid transport system ATPase component